MTLALALVVLGGCAGTTTPPATTNAAAAPAENRRGDDDPQVVIRADDPARVRQAAITLVSQYGGQVLQTGPDELLFSKAGGAAGGPAAAAPVYLVRLTLSPAGPGRVRASAAGSVSGPRPPGLSDVRARTLLMAGLLRLQAAVEAAN